MYFIYFVAMHIRYFSCIACTYQPLSRSYVRKKAMLHHYTEFVSVSKRVGSSIVK